MITLVVWNNALRFSTLLTLPPRDYWHIIGFQEHTFSSPPHIWAEPLLACSPATPDKREHIEQLKKWLLAFESGEVNQKVPEVSEDFWPIRSPKTGDAVLPIHHRCIMCS